MKKLAKEENENPIYHAAYLNKKKTNINLLGCIKSIVKIKNPPFCEGCVARGGFNPTRARVYWQATVKRVELFHRIKRFAPSETSKGEHNIIRTNNPSSSSLFAAEKSQHPSEGDFEDSGPARTMPLRVCFAAPIV